MDRKEEVQNMNRKTEQKMDRNNKHQEIRTTMVCIDLTQACQLQTQVEAFPFARISRKNVCRAGGHAKPTNKNKMSPKKPPVAGPRPWFPPMEATTKPS